MSGLGEFLADLDRVQRFGEALDRVRRRKVDRERGVIELEEIRPGVFAAPRARARRSVLDDLRREIDALR